MIRQSEDRSVVLHVITRMIRGGAQENTLATVLRVNDRKYRSILAAGPSEGPEGSLVDTAMSRGADIRFIPSLIREVSPVQDVKALLALVRLMRKERPSVVHTHTSKAGILGRLAAKIAGVPVVIHTPHGHVFHDYFGGLKTRVFVSLERYCARFADRLIMLTENEKRDHLALRIAKAERFETIHSGIDFSRYAGVARGMLRAEMGIPADASIIGTVGRLVPIKGQVHVIAAMPGVLRRIPHAYLAIAGSGPLREELEQAARGYGVHDRVRFAGFRENVAECLADFDVFVLPSLNEGMGRVLVEAMAMRLPVVASAVSGIKDLVDSSRNGLLVPPSDPNALADAITQILSDAEYARRLGDAAYVTAVPRYSLDDMISQIEQLYSKLLKQSGCRSAAPAKPGVLTPKATAPIQNKMTEEAHL